MEETASSRSIAGLAPGTTASKKGKRKWMSASAKNKNA